MKNLILYHSPFCGYCLKVMKYFEQNGISIELKDVNADSDVHEELVKLSGGTQVPCLSIDGKPLLESDLIIQWFEDNWNKGESLDT